MDDKVRRALDSITWYNGLAPVIFSWIRLEKENGHSIGCPDRYGALDDWSESDISQLQVFWMYAVEMFGSYGTSPRFGWITDAEGLRKWILDITELWRGSEEYDGLGKYRHSWADKGGNLNGLRFIPSPLSFCNSSFAFPIAFFMCCSYSLYLLLHRIHI